MSIPVPNELVLDDQVFDVDFSPADELVAAATITGGVSVYAYHPHENKLLHHLTHHAAPCRSVLFSNDGAGLFTASADCTIRAVDLRQGKIVWDQQEAHDDPINCMTRFADGSVIVSGDDEGCVKLWDPRQRACVWEVEENEDFISDMCLDEERNLLLVSSGDGTLSVFDTRKRKHVARSEQLDDELLSINVLKHGSLVVCGTQEGVVDCWKYGEWEDMSDRFPGHPQSIDTMIKIDEDTVFTGSSDGIIRIISIHPNRLLGVIGDHQDFPVEQMAVCKDKRFLASCSHDNTVKFWDVSFIYADDDDDEGEGEGEGNDDDDSEGWEDIASGEEDEGDTAMQDGDANTNATANAKKKGKGKARMQQDDDDDDSAMGDGIVDPGPTYKKKKKKKGRGAAAARGGGFFADL